MVFLIFTPLKQFTFQRDHKLLIKFRLLYIVAVIVMATLAIFEIVRMETCKYGLMHCNFGKYLPKLTNLVIFLIFAIYFLICIDSLYKRLKEEDFQILAEKILNPKRNIVTYKTIQSNLNPQEQSQGQHETKFH